jgi:hypothetical protein
VYPARHGPDGALYLNYRMFIHSADRVLGLPDSFLPGLGQGVSTFRFDEFLTHSEGFRKTGAGLFSARPRPAVRSASHEGRFFARITDD